MGKRKVKSSHNRIMVKFANIGINGEFPLNWG